MSLFLFDLAYLGTKGVLNLSYYLVKGSYNLIAGFAGYALIEEPLTEQEILLQEIKEIKDELKQMKASVASIERPEERSIQSTTGDSYAWIAHVDDSEESADSIMHHETDGEIVL